MLKFFRLGVLLAALAVILGALAAHGLKSVLSPESLESFNTGVRYQLIHAIAVSIFAVLFAKKDNKIIRRALFLFVAGIMLFSFSIYGLVSFKHFGISGASVLGPLTPIGGSLMISAWIYLLVYAQALWGYVVKKSAN